MGYSRKKKQIKGGGGTGERGVEDIAFWNGLEFF